MTRTLCDLCGKEIKTYDKTKWKLKYFWSDPYGSGWIPIDAHEECLKAVAKEARLRGVKMKGGEK